MGATLSKAEQALRAIGIINTWDVVKRYGEAHPEHERGHDVVLCRRLDTSRKRGGQAGAWQVCRPGYKTNPSGHWTDHGHKTFGVYGRSVHTEALQQAREWATERYGDQQWERLPGIRHDLFPAPVVAWVKAQQRAARKAGG